jgi:chloride channel 3/4/5
MAVISIATEWASDLKTGYCTAGWWLNRKFCCWEFMEGGGPGGTSPIPSSLKPSGGAGNATMLARAGEALEWGMALVQRAEVQPGSSSEACSDWQPWSSWTVVSWVIYVVFAVSRMQ